MREHFSNFWPLYIVIPMIIGFCALLFSIPTVTPKTPKYTYTIGEKAIYDCYGAVCDATIIGKTDDGYVIKFCGKIGWVDAQGCDKTKTTASSLAKKEIK